MVRIRLSRGGTKKRPFYTIVVADRRKARDGRVIERIGYFNPMATGKEIRLHLNRDRATYWMAQGAQATDTVGTLIKNFDKEAKKPAAQADAA